MDSIYKNYKKIKAKSYYQKNIVYKIFVKYVPGFLLGYFFPVIKKIKIKNKKILDIGSGTGIYSFIFRSKYNCDVDEVEPYLENIYDNKNIIKVKIDELNIDKKYDVILILDILEHLNQNEINKLFQVIKECLVEDGVAYIKVPNISSISGLESCFGDITHLNHYNDLKLKSLLENNDFIIMKIWGIGPNLRLIRFISSIIAFPFKLFLYIYLFSNGCSGKYMSPSILIKIKN